jgi:hypothetical protein
VIACLTSRRGDNRSKRQSCWDEEVGSESHPDTRTPLPFEIKSIMVGGRIERSLVKRELKRLVIEQQEDMARMNLYHLHAFKDVPLRGDHTIDNSKTLRGFLRPDNSRQS